MSQEDFDRFRRLVLGDSALQRDLREISDHELFASRIVSLAADRGLEVEAHEVDEALRESRRGWLERWI